MKYDQKIQCARIMSQAHRVARRMRALDTRNYKELFALALKVEHMKKRLITIIDINWLMANHPDVDLSLVTTLHKSDRFFITGGYYLTVEPYVKPQTDEQINYAIGVMIESEIKSGIKPRLD